MAAIGEHHLTTGIGTHVSERLSLGASRRSVATQFLTEVFIFAVVGAVVGLGVAAAGTKIFRLLAPNLPRVHEIALDWRILAYTLGSAVLITLPCGILPALRSTRVENARALASGNRTQTSGRSPIQWSLVAVQVALAVTLLTGA